MAEVLHARRSVASIRDLMRQLVGAFTGRNGDPTGLVEGVQLRVGIQALSLIRQAFVAKSRGGVDDAGESWAPLDSHTIAYGRRHPGRPQGPNPRRPTLSKEQDKRWRAIYASTLKRYPGETDRAAAYAWAALKAEGAETLLGLYGGMQVDILRDTAILLNSLSPGLEGNILRTEPGAAIVGTNVPYAGYHHHGTSRMPQRRLWPEADKWPEKWNALLGKRLVEGLVELLKKAIGGQP